LRRAATGGFQVADAVTPEALQEMGQDRARSRLLPLEVLVASIPRCDLGEHEAWAIRNGQELPVALELGEGEMALFGPAGEFIGVGKASGGQLAPARLLTTVQSG
jgi:tRNA pseudouridine55 synthase